MLETSIDKYNSKITNRHQNKRNHSQKNWKQQNFMLFNVQLNKKIDSKFLILNADHPHHKKRKNIIYNKSHAQVLKLTQNYPNAPYSSWLCG